MAMANFLYYDVFDIDLSKVRNDFDLNFLLLQTTSKFEFSTVMALREEEKKQRLPKEKGREKRKGKRRKEGERKYNSLMNEEGIIIFNFEVLLFTMLVFLLN